MGNTAPARKSMSRKVSNRDATDEPSLPRPAAVRIRRRPGRSVEMQDCDSVALLADENNNRTGSDSVRNNFKFADARLLVARHIEVRGHQVIGRHRHAAVVMRAAVADMA